jgi:hypothetical protein
MDAPVTTDRSARTLSWLRIFCLANWLLWIVGGAVLLAAWWAR